MFRNENGDDANLTSVNPSNGIAEPLMGTSIPIDVTTLSITHLSNLRLDYLDDISKNIDVREKMKKETAKYFVSLYMGEAYRRTEHLYHAFSGSTSKMMQRALRSRHKMLHDTANHKYLAGQTLAARAA